MTPLQMLASGLGVLLAVFIIFVAVPKGLLVAFREDTEARIKHRYPDASAVLFKALGASSYAVERNAELVWRAKGALVLTGQELRFFQVLPADERFIPLERITGLRLLHKELTATASSELLCVEFRGKQGPSALAFWLPKPAELKALIETHLPAAQA